MNVIILTGVSYQANISAKDGERSGRHVGAVHCIIYVYNFCIHGYMVFPRQITRGFSIHSNSELQRLVIGIYTPQYTVSNFRSQIMRSGQADEYSKLVHSHILSPPLKMVHILIVAYEYSTPWSVRHYMPQ